MSGEDSESRLDSMGRVSQVGGSDSWANSTQGKAPATSACSAGILVFGSVAVCRVQDPGKSKIDSRAASAE